MLATERLLEVEEAFEALSPSQARWAEGKPAAIV